MALTIRNIDELPSDRDRGEVVATTGQMKDYFARFAKAQADALDVMNYLQHDMAAALCKPGDMVLDVCCGRGLLLPHLVQRCPGIRGYVGVDIAPENATWEQETWPFPTRFVESNVASMFETEALRGAHPFGVIVYTSSIEHMQPTDAQDSLWECRKMATGGTQLFLSCPVTPDGGDPWKVQYRNHLYEPTRSDLNQWLQSTGWKVVESWGLLASEEEIRRSHQHNWSARRISLLPKEWWIPLLSIPLTAHAKEIALICEPA